VIEIRRGQYGPAQAHISQAVEILHKSEKLPVLLQRQQHAAGAAAATAGAAAGEAKVDKEEGKEEKENGKDEKDEEELLEGII
jgi:ribosomal protein L12E/L44/L45/RPP1/RPP2